MYKITIVLLTWQRIGKLKDTLKSLSKQTFQGFDVHISNANHERIQTVEKYVKFYQNKLDISVSHDSNSQYAFRRFLVARDLAQNGTGIVLFIDDDVEIPNTYVESCLREYEDKSYKSLYAWTFTEPEKGYYAGRTRTRSKNEKVHYCGTGASMVDASIFLIDDFFSIPEEGIKIEDLWLSYYADHKLNWKLQWLNIPGVEIGGVDDVALNPSVRHERFNKDKFLGQLIERGWSI